MKSPFTLTTDQERIKTCLCMALEKRATGTRGRCGGTGGTASNPSGLNRQRLLDFESVPANVFGVFGRRGAGKTTILKAVLEDLWTRYLKTERLVHSVREPVDCSQCPPHFPVGPAVVHQLRQRLRLERGDPSVDKLEPFVERPEDAFEKLLRSYASYDPAYRDVARDLAITPDHYAQSVLSETTSRFCVPILMDSWLASESRYLNQSVVVVALDDVDLAPDGLPAALLRSLLDELHQDRLLILIAADLDRLERQCAAGWAGYPHPTDRERDEELPSAQELLYKVIPADHRFEVPEWPQAARRYFPLHEKPSEGKGSTLERVLQEHKVAELLLPGIVPLLPRYPRGLKNLYDLFLSDGDARVANLSDPSAPLPGSLVCRPEEVLARLAEARAEHVLGRHLPRRPAVHWARSFDWGDRLMAPQAWMSLVKAAQGASVVGEYTPLWGIEPTTAFIPVKDMGDEAPLWVELLLNIAMAGGGLRRSDVALGIPWLRQRYTVAGVQVAWEYSLLRDVLRSASANLALEGAWTRWTLPALAGGAGGRGGEKEVKSVRAGDQVTAQVGLEPLIRALLGERQPLQVAVLSDLNVRLPADSGGVARKLVAGGEASTLPGTLRGLILLAHALEQVPWEALSARGHIFDPPAVVRLVAELVWGSFVRALEPWRRDDLDQDPFVSAPTSTDAPPYLSWSDRKVHEHFGRSRAMPTLHEDHKDHVVARDLIDTLQAFVKSEAFQGLLQRA